MYLIKQGDGAWVLMRELPNVHEMERACLILRVGEAVWRVIKDRTSLLGDIRNPEAMVVNIPKPMWY